MNAQGQFSIADSDFEAGESSFVRVKREDQPDAAYSQPIALVVDPSVTSSSASTINQISLSRLGTDLKLRWSLAASNNKPFKILFRRADNNTELDLTPMGLPANSRELSLGSQSQNLPAGNFLAHQVLGTVDQGGLGGHFEDGTIPPPASTGPVYITQYHHRDHLGTLRLITDEMGGLIEAHDYEPFGVELNPPFGAASRKKYTGHERDESTGLDYMLARYYGSNLARFLLVDPLADSARPGSPQTWNRYAYAFNNPIRYNDPNGKDGNDVANWVDRQVNAFTSWVDVNTGGGAAGVALNAAVGTAGDLVSGTADLLRVGAATGEAIGEGAGFGNIALAAGGDTLRAAALGTGMYCIVRSATTTTVVHFTDDAGRAAISESGNLRAGTYVTKPGEIPKGATASQVESKLEISAGKGNNSITVRTSRTNLKTPADGPTTSGGAAQKQLKSVTKVAPKKFKETQ